MLVDGMATLRISWSRRRLFTEGVLPLALALSLPRARGRDHTESPPQLRLLPGDRAASSPEAGADALLSTTGIGDRLTTPVSIDGHGPCHLLVDTGAERTVIAADLAERLALARGPRVMVEGIVRGEPTSLVEIGRLEMGSIVCSRLQVPTLPRSMLHADGYLGLDVLDGRRIIFDFLARTITVMKARGFFAALWASWNEADGVRVRTLGDSGRLRATDCLIDRVHASAFIDTGAETSIINEMLYAALQERNGPPTILTTETLTGVTGGRVIGPMTVLNLLRVGGLFLTFTPAVVADLPVFKLWGLNRQPALLIGMDCMRRCSRVSIDYGRKELHFQLASANLPQPLQAKLTPPYNG